MTPTLEANGSNKRRKKKKSWVVVEVAMAMGSEYVSSALSGNISTQGPCQKENIKNIISSVLQPKRAGGKKF